MNLTGLKKSIPYKWRVQSFSKNKAVAAVVAYIDARDVMDLLDECVGPENWMSDFKEVKGNVYCGVAIKIENDWVWKWDCGVESNQDSEKGEASDAFKRAAVKWGIGRFLYTLKIKYVKSNGPKNDSNKYPYVIDSQGQRVWDINEYVNNLPGDF